jgi:hypothetical protein
MKRLIVKGPVGQMLRQRAVTYGTLGLIMVTRLRPKRRYDPFEAEIDTRRFDLSRHGHRLLLEL